MDISKLLSKEVKLFIQNHKEEDVYKVLLQKERYPDLPLEEIVWQIQAHHKLREKLPSWIIREDVLFPAPVSLEQCSSESTASWKSKLVNGHYLMDLSGGLGVDSYFFSRRVDYLIYIEQSKELCEIAANNFEKLIAHNIQVICDRAENFEKYILGHSIDWIYVDPSRRDKQKGKVFLLEDCEPNVVQLLPIFLKRSENVLIKLSPMLDINSVINTLKGISNIWIISVQNEVKELLIHIPTEKNFSDLHIHAVDISVQNEKVFSFKMKEETDSAFNLGEVQQYLYEPSNAVLKSGAFKLVSKKFGVHKIHKNSHLYTSNYLIKEFQGRVFKVVGMCKVQKSALTQIINGQANLSVRNFPMTVKDLRKKLELKEGGDDYIFATTDCQNQKILIVCRKLERNDVSS